MSLSLAFRVDSLTVRLSLTFAKTGIFLTWEAFNAPQQEAFYRPEQRPIPRAA